MLRVAQLMAGVVGTVPRIPPAGSTPPPPPSPDLIPASRLIDWTLAGIQGGFPGRSAVDSTISSAGGNNSTSNTTAINNAITAAASGEVVRIPAGFYRTGSVQMKSGVTLRGAGPWCSSVSSLAIGTGTKVFSVPAGLPYVAGNVVRAWVTSAPGYRWMQGTVTSYSGTTLTLDITTTAGSGTYADWRVSITVLVPTTTSPLLRFGTNNLSSTTSGTYRTVTSGATRGSTSIVVGGSTPSISVGQLLCFSETNGSEVNTGGTANGSNAATWVDSWDTNGNRAKGEIVRVTSVSGSTIGFDPPLASTYANSPWVMPYTAECDGATVEDLMVFVEASGTAPTENVLFRKSVNCGVRGCYFDFGGGDHAAFDYSLWCEIADTDFWDGFDHGGGAYVGGILMRRKSSRCRVVDVGFSRINDSVMIEWGACGSVVAYNFETGGFNYSSFNGAGTTILPKSFTLNHGAHPQYSLLEGNVGRKVQADSYWGSSSDTLIYRNAIAGFGTASDPLNARGAPTTTINQQQANRCVDVWEGQLRYSALGNVLGNEGNWNGRSPVRKDAAGGVDYDRPYALVLDLGTESGTSGTVLIDPGATFIDHGNWDSITNGQVWDPSIENQTLPDSFAYSAKPGWWPPDMTWPPVDPANVPADPTTISNPAKRRLLSSVRQHTVTSLGHFETSSDGTVITASIARASFSGQGASSWDTSNDPNSLGAGATTNLTIEADSAHPVDNWLTINGASPPSGATRGMRVSHASDGCLLLAVSHTSSPAVGFHLKWNGAQQNNSPRDVAGWWNSSGHFQVLQFYDGASPYFHTHFQPNGGSNTGTNVSISKNHWYWFTMRWVDGGNTFSISCYDAEAGYALVGTSVGSITGSSTVKPSWFEIGLIKYSSGAGQSFDIDNIIYAWDGYVPMPS